MILQRPFFTEQRLLFADKSNLLETHFKAILYFAPARPKNCIHLKDVSGKILGTHWIDVLYIPKIQAKRNKLRKS